MKKIKPLLTMMMLLICSISFSQTVTKNPCESSTKHQQLDFWVGEWDVFNQNSQKVGTNSIKKIQDGCAIQENWTGGSGSTGTSLNFYNPASDKWEQLWVAATGYIIKYRGEFKDGAMRFTEGENVLLDGSKEKSRMTLTLIPEGNVIQFIEQSKDDGKTWYVWFKGTYVPMAEKGQ